VGGPIGASIVDGDERFPRRAKVALAALNACGRTLARSSGRKAGAYLASRWGRLETAARRFRPLCFDRAVAAAASSWRGRKPRSLRDQCGAKRVASRVLSTRHRAVWALQSGEC
jgi:hypothetical protein